MSANHISFDIETLGTKPGSVIASVGAVVFDPNAGVQTAEELKKNSIKILIDIRQSIALGMDVSGDTISWWMQQSDAARNATFNPRDKTDLKVPDSAVIQLNAFVRSVEKPFVWGNGASFDISLLEALMDKVNRAYPWAYTRIRCLRTLKAVVPFDYKDMPTNDLPHDCLADAIYQAQMVQLIAAQNPTLVFDK